MDVGDKVIAASADSYSDEDRAFYSFWYGHMLEDLMQPPLIGIAHSTARYIWDAARRTPSASTGEDGLPELDQHRVVEIWDSTESGGMVGRSIRFANAIARAAVAADRRAREGQQKPVAWLEAEPSARGRPAHEVVFSVVYSSRIHTKCAPMTSNPVWPLYAAPPLSSEPQSEKGESNA